MPIDIQIVGRNAAANPEMAREIRQKVKAIPGAVDVLIRQEVNTPTVMVNVDRDKANRNGLTQRDVANSMLISLSSSGQVAPNQWLNPTNGVSYPVTVQTPPYRIDSFDALQRIPITPAGQSSSQILRTSLKAFMSSWNRQPIRQVAAIFVSAAAHPPFASFWPPA